MPLCKHISFTIAIIYMLLMSACIKRPHHLVSVNPDFLERYYYKPGTYWIMKDSVTGRQDSFYIAANGSENITMRTGLQMQNITGEMQQLSADKTDTFFWEWRYVQSKLILKVQSKANRAEYYGCANVEYPLNITYTSFPLNSRYYADVNWSNTIADSSAASAGYSNSLYINESDGIIKLRLSHPGDPEKSFIWELVRKNIIL